MTWANILPFTLQLKIAQRGIYHSVHNYILFETHLLYSCVTFHYVTFHYVKYLYFLLWKMKILFRRKYFYFYLSELFEQSFTHKHVQTMTRIRTWTRTLRDTDRKTNTDAVRHGQIHCQSVTDTDAQCSKRTHTFTAFWTYMDTDYHITQFLDSLGRAPDNLLKRYMNAVCKHYSFDSRR